MADLENDVKIESFREKRIEQEVMRMKLSPLITRVFPIDYADAKILQEILTSLLTKNEKAEPYGSIQVDEHTNSLLIQATVSDLERIVPMIEKIDKPTPLIRIEANIVETTSETARSLGVQWGGIYTNKAGSNSYWITPGGSGGSADTNPVAGGYTPAVGAPGLSGQGFGVNLPVPSSVIEAAGGSLSSLGLMFGTIGGSILELQLQALQAQGKLKILSSPSITTLDNQMAFTENGEKVPYVTINEDGDNEVQFEDAVLRLEITPHVIDESNLKMKILVKKDEVDTTRDVLGNPFIIKKQTDTMLIAKNGETIVISGLSKKRESKKDQGVPWLKDIPGLGWLFKAEDRAEKLEEVLIFITPRILETERKS
jgi:type IV pilus assembly protein PilQ